MLLNPLQSPSIQALLTMSSFLRGSAYGVLCAARGFDLQSPEVQDQIDVTDARLK